MAVCLGRTFLLVKIVFLIGSFTVQAKPTITGSGVFIVGLERTLTCALNTVENVTYNPLFWSLDNVILTPNESNTQAHSGSDVRTFTIKYKLVVQPSDHLDVYYCNSSLPNDKSYDHWKVFVLQEPDLPVISGPSTVVSGGRYSWTCVVDGAGGQAPTISWDFGDGTPISSQLYNQTNRIYNLTASRLEIINATSIVTLDIAAGTPRFVLRCWTPPLDKLDPSTPNLMDTFTVTVHYPPQMTNTNGNQTATAGYPVTLTCPVTAGSSPPLTKVTWYQDGVAVNMSHSRYSGSEPNSPDLQINPVGRMDRGFFVCSVSNGAGTTNSSSSFLNVFYTAVISYSENPVSGELSSQVTLSCQINANPDITNVLWYRIDSATGARIPLRPDNNPGKYTGGTETTTPALTIRDLTLADTGLYRCAADNNVGRGEGDDIQVNIIYKPRITVTPFLTSTEPANVTIPCDVDARPSVTSVTWYKDGQVLNTSDATHYTGGTAANPALTIYRAGLGDGGSYYCVAANSLGSSTSNSTVLTVNYFPVITVPQTTVVGTYGGSVSLPISVSANPGLRPPQWYRRNGNVDTPIDVTSGKYGGGTSSDPSLVINNLAVEDAGTYVIRVRNSVGDSQATLTLSVSYTPSTPTITYQPDGYKENQLIQLTCSSNGFPQPTYQWYHGSQLLAVTTPTLTIATASPEDAGRYRCVATNNQGTSQSSVDVVVFYKPRAGATSNVTASTGDTVTLQCVTDSNPEPWGYRWTFNGQPLGSNSRDLTVFVSNSSFLGRYDCFASNQEGESSAIPVFIVEEDLIPPTVGQSTASSGLSLVTLILIIIICVILFIILVLIIIFCCASGRCACKKKDNNVAPSQPPPVVPVVIATPLKPASTKPSTAKSNGYTANNVSASQPLPPVPRTKPTPAPTPIPAPAPTPVAAAAGGGGGASLKEGDQKKSVPPGMGTASLGYGLTISVPDRLNPRPHHLPPLGTDGPSEEALSAHEDTKGKKKRRRRDKTGDDTPRSDDLTV